MESVAKVEAEIADLSELRVLLEALRLVVLRKRAAIAALNTQELNEATAEERRLADEISLIQHTRIRSETSDDKLVALRRSVLEVATRVRLEAQANAALVADSRHILGCVLGTALESAGYDRRARRQSEPRLAFAKAV